MKKSNKNSIPRRVLQFFIRNEVSAIDKAFKDVNDDPLLQNCKRATFYTLGKRQAFLDGLSTGLKTH